MCKTYSRGKHGEKNIQKILSKLNKGKYKVFNNMIIEYEGKLVEIDHLIISNFGIYIIETKNITGKIKGYVEDEYWVKVKNKEKFYNPINQNKIHINAFKHKIKECGYNCELPIYSIIVFVNNSNIETDATNVINDKELISKIFRLNKQYITEEIRDEIYVICENI